MKTIFCLLVLTLAAAQQTQAQGAAGAIAKQRAKDVVRENNVRQGIGAPAPQTAPAAQPVRPAPANPVAKLRADIAAIVDSPAVAETMKKQLAADMLVCARGSHKPTPATVEKFANSVSAALAGKGIQTSVQSRLVNDINLALNSASLSAQRTTEVGDDVQAVLQTAGASRALAVGIAGDLKAIATELQAAK